MFGLILVILGVLFLLEEMGIITGSFWGYFWPVILIVVGFSLMDKDKKKGDCNWFFCGKAKNHKHDHHEHNDHKVVDEQ